MIGTSFIRDYVAYPIIAQLFRESEKKVGSAAGVLTGCPALLRRCAFAQMGADPFGGGPRSQNDAAGTANHTAGNLEKRAKPKYIPAGQSAAAAP